jgi:hypothetical protein
MMILDHICITVDIRFLLCRRACSHGVNEPSTRRRVFWVVFLIRDLWARRYRRLLFCRPHHESFFPHDQLNA